MSTPPTAAPELGIDPLAPHSLSPTELKHVLAAEREAKAFLALRDPGGELQLKVLDPTAETLTVGRRSDVDVAIGWDGEVSALHAELESIAGEWTVVDDGLSRNGTFVNGHRVHSRLRLRDGDRIRVGKTVIAFVAHSEESASTTVTAGEMPAAPELSQMQRRVLIALCRPFRDGDSFATPASNQQIADEVYLSLVAVKMHLRALFLKLGLSELPQNQKRARLVECVLQLGLVSPRDLE